jgi:hypothetical protein
MSGVRLEQSDVKFFRHTDRREAIRGLQEHLLPKLARLRTAALGVAERRLAIDPKALVPVHRPANRTDANEVVFYKEAYAGVSWPRGKGPLAVKAPEGKPRYYPPTYLYFGLYPDGHLRVQLLWYRYSVEASFHHRLRALVDSQAGWLLGELSQRGIRAADAADQPLAATLERPDCVWVGRPLPVPIVEGDTAWREAVEHFVHLLPLARAAWQLAVGGAPDLAADCLALRAASPPDPRLDPDRGEGGLPDEVDPRWGYPEGAVRRVLVNAYERSPDARRRCVEHHGTSCCICGFNFGATYGGVAEDFIHVHHLRPLSEVGGEYHVDPVADLRPVCPNCHAVLHLGGRLRSIDEVKQLLAANRAAAPGTSSGVATIEDVERV